MVNDPAPFSSIAELFDKTLDIHHVFGDPIQHGDRTVVPVATVAYGFGAGGGRGLGRRRASRSPSAEEMPATGRDEGEGSGGGGGVRLTPAGALEISATGTRFVRFPRVEPMLAAIAAGLVAGWLIGRRR